MFNKFVWAAVVLATGAGGWLPARVEGQDFSTVYSFTAVQSPTNIDGAFPEAGLVASGDTLFGAAMDGGMFDDGTVFSFDVVGMKLGSLRSFDFASDGSGPVAALVLSGNRLYGMAHGGGPAGSGTVFAMNTDGSGFTNLHSFTATFGSPGTNSDGASPVGGLVLSGNRLYGTTAAGGGAGYGTVFALNTNGSNFTLLHSFTGGGDGGYPQAGLVVSGGMLYGTTEVGGVHGNGTVFSLTTNGAVLLALHHFGAVTFVPATGISTNGDGAYPQAGLVLSGNRLYGTAEEGGTGGDGVVFAVGTDGSGFANLHSFTALSSPVNHGNNSDGAYPLAGLALSGNMVYGAANAGGSAGYGTVFGVNIINGNFTTLHSFSSIASDYGENGDGAEPIGDLILMGNTLYGTASRGGESGAGAIFSITVPPQLNIAAAGSNVILTWPASVTGYTLQSSTNLVSTNWSAVTPSPVTVNGLNTVTNAMSGGQMFYRLMQQAGS